MGDELPPLILELRARAGQLYTTLGKVRTDVAATTAAAGGSVGKMADDTEESSGRMGSRLQNLGGVAATALGIIGGGAAVVGYESLKSAAAFQRSTTLLVTAGGEAQSNLAGVQSGIENIAEATGENAENLSAGMYIVEKAGMHGAAGLTVLKAAAQSAMAEGTDMPTMTNAITSALMSYGKGSGYAATMASQMDRAAGLSKTTMQEFAGSLSTVLPIASAAGVSFAQVGGAIATLTQHGTTADEATQELANTIRNLQAPSLVAQKAMQQIGLNVTDVSTELGQRGLTGTIALITDAVKSKLGPAGTVVVDAFQKQASASDDLNIMLSKMPPTLAASSRAFENGTESYAAYYKAAKALGGPQYEMAKQFIALTGNAKGFNNILKSGSPAQQTAAKELKDIMGGATGLNTALMLSGTNAGYFNGAVSQISGQTARANGDISNWAETQTTLAVQLDKAKEHIQVLGLQIGAKLIPAVEKMLEVTTKAFSWLASHETVLITLGVIIGTVLVAAIGAAVTAWITASVAFAVSPLGLIIEGCVALIAAIILLATHWSQVWAYIERAAQDAGQFLQRVWNGIAGFFRNLWQDITSGARSAWHLFEQYVISPVESLWARIQDIGGRIAGFFQGIWTTISTAADDAWQGITNGIESAVSYVGSVVADIINAAVDAINIVISGINYATGGLSDVWSWTGLPAIPQIPPIPQVSLAGGGIVRATPGGIIARIAEAGADEAVIPLDGRHGLPGAGGQTTVVNVTVQGSVIAETDLAELVRTQLLRLGARHGGINTYQAYSR